MKLYRNFVQKMKRLMDHMSKHHLPPHLVNKIRTTMHQKWKTETTVKKKHDFVGIYKEFPTLLLYELAKHVYRDMWKRTEILKDFQGHVWSRFIATFTRHMTRRTFAVNEFVLNSRVKLIP
eukprot:UN10287